MTGKIKVQLLSLELAACYQQWADWGLLQNLINKENFISTGGWMESIIFVLNKDDVETFLELVPEAANKKVELDEYWIEVF